MFAVPHQTHSHNRISFFNIVSITILTLIFYGNVFIKSHYHFDIIISNVLAKNESDFLIFYGNVFRKVIFGSVSVLGNVFDDEKIGCFNFELCSQY